MAPIFITIQNLNILQLPLYSSHTKSHCTGASLVGDTAIGPEFSGPGIFSTKELRSEIVVWFSSVCP